MPLVGRRLQRLLGEGHADGRQHIGGGAAVQVGHADAGHHQHKHHHQQQPPGHAGHAAAHNIPHGGGGVILRRIVVGRSVGILPGGNIHVGGDLLHRELHRAGHVQQALFIDGRQLHGLLVGLSGIQGSVFVSCGLLRGGLCGGILLCGGAVLSRRFRLCFGFAFFCGGFLGGFLGGFRGGFRRFGGGICRFFNRFRFALPCRFGGGILGSGRSDGFFRRRGLRRGRGFGLRGCLGGSIRRGLGRDVVVFLAHLYSSQNPLGVAPSWKNRRQPGPGCTQ